jgi:hypothetical protein
MADSTSRRYIFRWRWILKMDSPSTKFRHHHAADIGWQIVQGGGDEIGVGEDNTHINGRDRGETFATAHSVNL